MRRYSFLRIRRQNISYPSTWITMRVFSSNMHDGILWRVFKCMSVEFKISTRSRTGTPI